jgi:poly(A) polymerase
MVDRGSFPAKCPISRRDIDPDALSSLPNATSTSSRSWFGSVAILILGRRPKDFDIGTSRIPIRSKLFRCWIIGGAFGSRVSSGRRSSGRDVRQVAAGEEVVADGVPAPDPSTPEGEHLIHHDNTFGTPEEDAFRRDFTINALVYDISNFSVIDYVGGLEDLRAGVVRSIGDPDVRLREDPVRMLRAIALAARLDFTLEPALLDAIRTHREEIAKSSPPRLLEEYYKILRAGSSEKAFRSLAEVGLLEPISVELHKGATDPLWRSLTALDTYRRRFDSTPDTLTNAILLGTLLLPLGISLNPPRGQVTVRPVSDPSQPPKRPRHAPGPKLGELPLARRDVERLRLIIGMQRRLRDMTASPKAQRALTHRNIFRDALTWLEIHGDAPELVEHWKAMPVESGAVGAPTDGTEVDPAPSRRRRRRRRRRRGFAPPT